LHPSQDFSIVSSLPLPLFIYCPSHPMLFLPWDQFFFWACTPFPSLPLVLFGKGPVVILFSPTRLLLFFSVPCCLLIEIIPLPICSSPPVPLCPWLGKELTSLVPRPFFPFFLHPRARPLLDPPAVLLSPLFLLSFFSSRPTPFYCGV